MENVIKDLYRNDEWKIPSHASQQFKNKTEYEWALCSTVWHKSLTEMWREILGRNERNYETVSQSTSPLEKLLNNLVW